MHARQALGLGLHQIAAATDQQPDLEIDLSCRFDPAQIHPGSDLVGDGAGVTRVGLVLATNRALASAVDGDAWHVDGIHPASSAWHI